MFHAQDGLRFERGDDDSVTVHWEDKQTTLAAPGWASVIASMCARGESAETFGDAESFHTSTA